MIFKQLLEELIEKEIAELERFGERVSLKSLTGRRMLLTIVCGIIWLCVMSTKDWFVALIVLIVYLVCMHKTNNISVITRLAKKSPDVPIAEIIRNDCKMKKGKIYKDDTKMLSSSKRQKRNMLKLDLIAGIVFVFGVFFGSNNFTTEMRLEEYLSGYRLVEYRQAFYDESTELIVPAEYNGKPIIAVADKAFFDNDILEKVVIPDSVAEMGSAVFKECDNLKMVLLSNKLEVMGGACFEACGSLESVFLPDSLKELRGESFKGCTALTEVKLPSGITEIKGNTFENCSSLHSIEIPYGVTRIAAHAFHGCISLSKVHVPDTVTEIGSSAFRNCKSLLIIELPKGVSINERAFKESPTEIVEKAFSDEEYEQLNEEISAIEEFDALIIHKKGTPIDEVTLFDGYVYLTDYKNIGEVDPECETIEAPDDDLKAYLLEAKKQGARGVVTYVYSEKGSKMKKMPLFHESDPITIEMAINNIKE